ncbi:unnamed protein product, partial [Meganyctiphanes norvegica]
DPTKWILPEDAIKIYVWIRPQDYDMAYSCQPNIGWEPEWKEHTQVDMPMSRAPGAMVNYTCEGELLEEGNETAPRDERSTEGSVTCDYNDEEKAYIWSKDVVF